MWKHLILLCALFSFSSLSAQPFLVSGKISDSQGSPVPFVSVSEKGTATGTTSKFDGSYSIMVQGQHSILVFSSVGFVQKEIVVGRQRVINITMENSENQMQEVVVTALGIQRSRKSISYATSRVSSSNINDPVNFKTWKRNGALDENSVQLSVGNKDNLPLKSVQVTVKVDGFRARVLFDYFFYNDKGKRLRGDFKLKLPVGASPFYFAFGGTEYFNKDKQVHSPFIKYATDTAINLHKDTVFHHRNNSLSQLKEAIVAPTEKAAYAYNEVVRGKIDPALMEWAGADVFNCSVFPLEHGKLHRIVIGYDINLLESGANAVFNLLLPYKSIPNVLDIDIAQADGLTYKVEPAISNQINVTGHHIYHLENFNHKSFSIATRSAVPVFLQQHGKEQYFAVSFKPEVPQLPAGEDLQQAVFMLDVSLSSQPDKFNVWLKTMDRILANNRGRIKKFAVMCFSVDAFWWKEQYSNNNEYNVAEFLEYADKLSLAGATDLAQALKEASSPAWAAKSITAGKTIFLLSDGDASWGEDNLYQLSNKLNSGEKLFAFTTGFSGTDTRVLDHLARQSNGAVFSIINEEDVEDVSKAIHNKPWKIKEVSMDNGNDLLIAGRPHFIFAGQKLLVTGRGSIDPGSIIKLVLQQGNQETVIRVPASTILQSDLVKRIYGQVAVNQLEEFSFKTEKAAQRYSTHFDVAGRTCAWVMLESARLYSTYGLTNVENAEYIKSTTVNQMIAAVLKEEETAKSLGSAKADLIAWLTKMEKDRVIRLDMDSLFKKCILSLPESAFVVDIPLINGTITNTNGWYRATNAALNESILDYDQLMKAINAEKNMEGTVNAFKLISSFAENNRSDLTLLRDVAFMLNSWDMHERSYELSKRLIKMRPAEPPSYSMVAANLVKMGKTDLAMIYYDVCVSNAWDERFEGFELISAVEYYRLLNEILLGKYKSVNMDFVKARHKEMSDFLASQQIAAGDADLMIVISWNTDNTDVDLHVREPNNQTCYYENPHTSNGGILSNDATDGFGPEMYFIKKAVDGKYHLDIEYYAESDIQTSSKSKILVTAYKNWGRSDEKRVQKVVEVKRSKDRKKRLEDDEDVYLKDVLVMEF